MDIENREDKVNFLEKILEFASENPEIVSEKGKVIFFYEDHVFDEKCIIELRLDEKGKSYFKVKGDFNEKNGNFYSGQDTLVATERYFQNDLRDFKNSFYLYKEIDVLEFLKK